MKKNKLKIISSATSLAVIFFSLFFSTFVYAADVNPPAPTTPPKVDCRGIVPCCEASGCDFNGLIEATKKVVNWGVTIALSLAVVVLAYAGFLYLTSASNPSGISKANGMFVKVLWGMLYILSAWLIVTLIMSALASSSVPIFLG